MSNQQEDQQKSQEKNLPLFKEVSYQQITEFASNRTELYDKLAKVYDLPDLNGAIPLDYLKSLISNECPYFVIKRTLTRPLPFKNYRKSFDARDTLKILEKILIKYGKKPSGFTTFNPPNISWMLRVIIALQPDQMQHILNFQKPKISSNTNQLLSDKKININQEVFNAIFSGKKSTKKNTAFRSTDIEITAVEDRKIEKLNKKIATTNQKINEYKMLMEKILIRREEFQQEIEMLNVEKELKIKRYNVKNNRKLFQKESMDNYLRITKGEDISFDRVEKMFGTPSKEVIRKAMLERKKIVIEGNYANDSLLHNIKPSQPYISPKNSENKDLKKDKMEEDNWSKSKELALQLAEEESSKLSAMKVIQEQSEEESLSQTSQSNKGGVQTKLNFQKIKQNDAMSLENTPNKNFISFKKGQL